MIKTILIINTSGKPRLTRFFDCTAPEEQQDTIRKVFAVLSKRPPDVCSFVEDEAIFGPGTKLVYRAFATLFFAFLVDDAESELAVLDLIQVFVETLDKCFENVCELDLVFNTPKVNLILDELVMGGLVQETSSAEVIRAVDEILRLEKRPDPPPTQLKGRGGQIRHGPR